MSTSLYELLNENVQTIDQEQTQEQDPQENHTACNYLKKSSRVPDEMIEKIFAFIDKFCSKSLEENIKEGKSGVLMNNFMSDFQRPGQMNEQIEKWFKTTIKKFFQIEIGSDKNKERVHTTFYEKTIEEYLSRIIQRITNLPWNTILESRIDSYRLFIKYENTEGDFKYTYSELTISSRVADSHDKKFMQSKDQESGLVSKIEHTFNVKFIPSEVLDRVLEEKIEK
jgi:hypothetical protein